MLVTETPPGIPSPFDSRRRIRAVLFDLDGTLYRQRPMRALMAVELMTAAFGGPAHARRTWQGLAAFRKAQETLRAQTPIPAQHQLRRASFLAQHQVRMAAERTGLPPDAVEAIASEWMFERPLKYLRLCRASGLLELLSFLDNRGVALGVLSDYPPTDKLYALGLEDRFSLVLCSTDNDIGAFKPHPKGFLKACETWRLNAGDVLVVGDRFDVDAAGASAAGMPCAIIASRRTRSTDSNARHLLVLPSFERLLRVLDNGR